MIAIHNCTAFILYHVFTPIVGNYYTQNRTVQKSNQIKENAPKYNSVHSRSQ